jgi:dUTPase
MDNLLSKDLRGLMLCWDTLFQTNLTKPHLDPDKTISFYPEVALETEERLGTWLTMTIRREAALSKVYDWRAASAVGTKWLDESQPLKLCEQALQPMAPSEVAAITLNLGGAASSTLPPVADMIGRTLKVKTTWELKDTAEPEPFTTVLALLDSGSCISGVTKEFLLRIRTESGQPIELQPLDAQVEVTSASDNPVPALGKVNVSFKIEAEVIQHTLFVFQKLPYHVLLGGDFLKQQACIIDWNKQTVSIKNITVRMNATSVNTHNHPGSTYRTLTTSQATTIQPNTTTWIKMQGIHNSIPSHFTTGYIQADYLSAVPISIVVSNGLVSLDTPDSVNILVSNITDSPAHIQQGTQLAYIQPIQQASIDIAEAINDELRKKGLVKAALCAVGQADVQPEVDAFWEEDDKLSFNVENVVMGDPDPPMDASISDLERGLKGVCKNIAGIPSTAMQELERLLSQAQRIRQRLEQERALASTGEGELPPTLSFEKGYGHLSLKQLRRVKAAGKEQAHSL